MNAPSIRTHIAATEKLPDEPKVTDVDRPDLPVPSLWQRSVVAVSRYTGQKVILHSVNHATCQFRAFYPEAKWKDADGVDHIGKFGSRTEWFSFDPRNMTGEWEAQVTLSPEELTRRAVETEMLAAIESLDAKDAALVQALCDDPEPAKNFAKMQLLIAGGLIKAPAPKVDEDAKLKAGKK